MKLARRQAPERLDMTPLQLLNQHNMRQEKEKKLAASSRDLSHLAFIGAPYWSHFTRGDPYGEFQRDKNLLKRPKGLPNSDERPKTEPVGPKEPKEVPSTELTGTFDNVKMDGSRAYLPAYLLWSHHGPLNRVPFPEVDHLKEVTGSLRRPKSEGLIKVRLQPVPDPAPGKRSVHHTHSSICLGLRRNSYERTLL
mmetsp:Transcript_90082/g.143401  ORF Transcript_90082/g.143401 Transcript_90082/m.143401 type:complete len:195 (+) Transcript_90082:78-662(+)